MSKINHERPTLKYIDNIRREIKRLSALSNKDSNGNSYAQRNSTIDEDTWKKMLKINLTDIELEKIFGFIDLLNNQVELSSRRLKLLEIEFQIHEQLSEQKKSLKKELKQIDLSLSEESDQIELSMTVIVVHLIFLDAFSKIDGREKGIIDWLNLLGKEMEKIGLASEWNSLFETIFNRATKIFGKLSDNPDALFNLLTNDKN